MTVSSPDPSGHVKKEMTDSGDARPRCGRFHDDQNKIASNKEVIVKLRHCAGLSVLKNWTIFLLLSATYRNASF